MSYNATPPVCWVCRVGLGNLDRSCLAARGGACRPSALAATSAIGGPSAEWAGLGRVAAVTAVATAPTVAGDVAGSPAMEAMLRGEGELSYLDRMEVQHGVVRRDDGGDDRWVAGDLH